MDKDGPTLFFADSLISLRKIQENIYEPRNVDLLLNASDKIRKGNVLEANSQPKYNNYPPYKSTEGLPIVLFGEVGKNNSLNVVLSNVAQALYNRGVDVRICPIGDSKTEDSNEWIKFRHLVYNAPNNPYAAICIDRNFKSFDHSIIDYSAVIDANDSFLVYRRDILERWNRVDTVFTYSNHSMREMRSAGVKNAKLMPLGVDLSVFRRVDVSRDFSFPVSSKILFKNFEGDTTKARFVFMMVGMIQSRKGLTEALEAYQKSFDKRDDVLLWVHGRVSDWGTDESKKMNKDGPPMLWTDGSLEEESLVEILNRADCYVSPHRLEGFGLLPLQAMACGTPTIINNYSGPKDYANSSNSLMLSSTEEYANENGIPAEIKWAKCNIQELGEKMLYICSFENEAIRYSREGISTAKEWSWNASADAIINDIELKGLKISKRKTNFVKIVDILIPVRSGGSDINKMLDSLCKIRAGTEYRVTICDDGSDDNTWEVLNCWMERDKPFELKIIKNQKPLGSPATRNRLLAETNGETCFMCDCDLVFTQGNWLIDLVGELEASSMAFAAPMLTMEDGKITSGGGTTDDAGVPCVHRFFGQDKSLPEANIACEVLYAPSAALLFKRDILNTIGGMWEAYRPATFEDVDWIMKARKHGLGVWYAPSIKMIHNEGSFRRKPGSDAYHKENRALFISQWPTILN